MHAKCGEQKTMRGQTTTQQRKHASEMRTANETQQQFPTVTLEALLSANKKETQRATTHMRLTSDAKQ